MLKLYSVRLLFRAGGSLQPIIVSERNKSAAINRAKIFACTCYREPVVLDHAHEICSTPDDVLDWI